MCVCVCLCIPWVVGCCMLYCMLFIVRRCRVLNVICDVLCVLFAAGYLLMTVSGEAGNDNWLTMVMTVLVTICRV